MQTIRVIIADDEPLARENLRDLLSVYPEIEVVAESGTVAQTRQLIGETEPDAVFLDIQMPGGSGFDVFESLSRTIQVVFVTAYDAFAVRAFQVNAIDYLLKPIDRARLAGAVSKLAAGKCKRVGSDEDHVNPLPALQPNDDLLVKKKDQYFLVSLNRICAIRAYRNYTEAIDAQEQAYIFRRSMKEWRRVLPSPPFIHLDRSSIINTDQISGWRPRGRRVEVTFSQRVKCLLLGRTASDRFKKMIPSVSPAASAVSLPAQNTKKS